MRLLFVGLILLSLLIAACQPRPNQVFIEIDGSRQSLTTEAATVREALAEAEIELEPLDRVSPDLYVELEPGLEIKVTRVTEEIETERETIPFERETVINEALATGETRLAQLGVNGEVEISHRVVYEDGEEVSRTEISRVPVIPPVPEILVVGPQGSLPSVPVEGTIAYLSNGNAWLMRDSSGSRRALTTEGDLDGRVFDLSPDGRHLLYTTALTNEIELPLNDLWLASTTIVGEKPITLGVQGVLQAAWSPVITQSRLAYSTAERTANPPGWRANNDLWLLTIPEEFKNNRNEKAATPEPVEILPPNTQGLYPWWGTSLVWSPDGTKLAYARADQIGMIEVEADRRNRITPLMDFVPLETFSDWVWVPSLSWSPDGRFIAATVHGPSLASEPAEESQVFDLWLISTDGEIKAKVADQVGMWSNPAWSEAGIAFGEALNPLQSVTSRYKILLMDKDGSNRRQIFPFSEEVGVQLPDLVWSPEEERLLFTYNGNLFTTGPEGGLPKQLTANVEASHPQWMLYTSAITVTEVVTDQTAVTGTQTLTGTPTVTVTATSTPTLTATPGLNRSTPSVTPSATSGSPTTVPAVTVLPTTPTRTPTRRATATPWLTATATATSTSTGTIQPTSTATATLTTTR